MKFLVVVAPPSIYQSGYLGMCRSRKYMPDLRGKGSRGFAPFTNMRPSAVCV